MAKAIVFEMIRLKENGINQKTRISLFAYPLSEVLGKPLLSNKQCRNPRCVYAYTRAYPNIRYTRVHNTPHEHLPQPCFRTTNLKIPSFQKVKNKR